MRKTGRGKREKVTVCSFWINDRSNVHITIEVCGIYLMRKRRANSCVKMTGGMRNTEQRSKSKSQRIDELVSHTLGWSQNEWENHVEYSSLQKKGKDNQEKGTNHSIRLSLEPPSLLLPTATSAICLGRIHCLQQLHSCIGSSPAPSALPPPAAASTAPRVFASALTIFRALHPIRCFPSHGPG